MAEAVTSPHILLVSLLSPRIYVSSSFRPLEAIPIVTLEERGKSSDMGVYHFFELLYIQSRRAFGSPGNGHLVLSQHLAIVSNQTTCKSPTLQQSKLKSSHFINNLSNKDCGFVALSSVGFLVSTVKVSPCNLCAVTRGQAQLVWHFLRGRRELVYLMKRLQ